jgi:hypothetical protein
LYSCGEIHVNCIVGLLALLSGPPASPDVLLRPPGFTCLDCSPEPSVQWLPGSRYFVVTEYRYAQETASIELLAFSFFDTTKRVFARHDTTPRLAGRQFLEVGNEWLIPAEDASEVAAAQLCVSPDRLVWQAWKRLRR